LSEARAREDWVQIRIPEQRAEQAKRLARLIAREPFQKRSWAELGFFLASSVLAYGAVALVGVLGLAGLVLTVLFVGALLIAGALRTARGLGRWQRQLARRVLGEDIPEPQPFGARPGLVGWWRASLGDRAAWRAVGYFVAKVPLTIFGVWFALSMWLEALLGIASPLAGPGGPTRFGVLDRLSRPGDSAHLRTFLTGLVFLFVAPWAMRLVVYIDRRMMHLFLGPDAATSRVRSLEESRSKTLDAATDTLRRIERDLHDGTQAQLVALAMRLGQAKEKLQQLHPGDDSIELEAVRRLVDEAHRGAKEAITDLRDLARGIHPPALDTGLEHALTTLAARSPVPTQVSVHRIETDPGHRGHLLLLRG
jgi:signal transduction histidine kinase